MNEPIRILIVEDRSTDAVLAQREIKRVLTACVFECVETHETYLAALETFQPDLIISDYHMPRFDGLTALKLALEHVPLTPVIIFTGAINEDTAVACMKAGATDYVIKEHIKRLGTAVVHALEERQLRRERQLAEAALQASEARLASIIESAMDAIISIDADQRIILFNAAAEAMFGCPAAAAVGQTLEQFIPARFWPSHTAYVHTFGRTGITNRMMGRASRGISGRRINGEEFPVEASISQVEVAGTKLYTVILRDITERKQAEEALRQSEERFAKAFRVSSAALSITRFADGCFIDVNESFLKIFGYRREELIGHSSQDFSIFITPEHRVELVRTLQAQGYIRECETTARTRSGEIRDLLLSAELIDLDHEPHILELFFDITQRKQAETALRELAENMAVAQRIAHFGSWEVKIASDFTPIEPHLWSEECYHIFGLVPGSIEITTAFFMSCIHPDDRIPLAQIIATAIQNHADYSYEHRIIRSDGAIRYIHEQAKVILDEHTGQPVKIIGTAYDITARKQAEEQLLYQANLLQNVNDAIIATDVNFTITSWNQAAEVIYGWSAREAIGQSVGLLLQSDYGTTQPEQARQDFFADGKWKGEVTQKHKNGTPITILASVSAIKDSAGQVVGTVAVNRDITERKQAEATQAKLAAQLRQAQKMESIGLLAGGVAHDFNNLLTVIKGYCDFIQSEMSPDDPLHGDVEHIQLASDRAATLTRQLLAFSRKQLLAPTVLNLNDLLSQLHKLLERLIGEDITLTTVLQPDLWQITADPGQIEQVMMNLVINARDAMPTGGLLTIETRNVELDADYAQTHLGASNTPCVMLAITDTGCGMDEAVRSRIFEPFFTTKEPGRGTGLGLATVYGIIQQSGGQINVYSEPGQGTTFKIYLPINESGAPAHNDSPTHGIMHTGDETILLVEDDEQVRQLAGAVLQSKGYTVLEARHGDEALSIAGTHDGAIDLLITDVVMPRMSGRALAERLRAGRPHLKIIFMSGYTDDTVIRHGLLTAEVEFLHKPFSTSTLTAKVRQVLDT